MPRPTERSRAGRAGQRRARRAEGRSSPWRAHEAKEGATECGKGGTRIARLVRTREENRHCCLFPPPFPPEWSRPCRAGERGAHVGWAALCSAGEAPVGAAAPGPGGTAPSPAGCTPRLPAWGALLGEGGERGLTQPPRPVASVRWWLYVEGPVHLGVFRSWLGFPSAPRGTAVRTGRRAVAFRPGFSVC